MDQASASATKCVMATTTFFAPAEAVSQLEQAQCASPTAVSTILRRLVPRLRRPHETVTEAALTLLQIHPHETIPYIPDLVFDSSADTTSVLQSFSNLLLTDRTLLVPIIGILPDLPLTPAHMLHARATLSFAFSVVDEPDLPAIVHALLRSSETASSAVWASRAVRTGLSRPGLTPSITPLLAHVLADVLRASTSVARALRMHAGSPFLWPDLLIWILSFSPRLASPLPRRQAYASIRSALQSGLLSNPSRCREHVEQAAPALAEIPPAVHRFVSAIVRLCPSRLSDIIGCIHLLRALIRACPAATEPIISDLAADTRTLSRTVLRALIHSGISVPHVRGALSENVSFVCEGHKSANPQLSSTLWNQLFVKVRKGLLFGQDDQRRAALQLASAIVGKASKSAVQDVLSLMNECISRSLADSAAVDMLTVTNNAIMRGLTEASFVKDLFTARVVSQCPGGCFFEEVNEDNRAVGLDAISVQIDVGLIWDQPPSAVDTVVSAAVSCMALGRSGDNIEKLSSLVLNVTVLVPVMCISLYEAVDHMNQSGANAGGRGTRLGERSELPEEVSQMDSHDLTKAVSAFGVGMSSIVGILNTTCCSLARSKRVIDRRAIGDNDEHETGDHKATWALLERLTELHRMMDALSLGHEVLMQRSNDGRKDKQHRGPGRRGRKKSTPKRKYEGADALSKADAIVSNARKSLFGHDWSFRAPKSSAEMTRHRFPPLRLESVISCVAAVPDESEMCGKVGMSSRERDAELVQIDIMLFRLLLRYMREATMHEMKHTRGTGNRPKDDQTEVVCDEETLFPDLPLPPNGLDQMRAEEANHFIKELRKQQSERNDLFFVDDDESTCNENSEVVEKSDACDVRWAEGTVLSSIGDMDYIDDAVSALGDEGSDKIHATEVLHSPTFAALLLDRAATYTSLSRNARDQSKTTEYAGELVEISGMALTCFVLILRELPSLCEQFSSKDQETASDIPNPWEVILSYVEDMSDHVLTRTPTTFAKDERVVWPDSEDFQSISPVILTLEWIRIMTPDSLVAGIAVEALMTLAELDVFKMKLSRQATFKSLVTVYEYDNGVLWDDADKSLVTHDPLQDWLVRYRGQVKFADALKLEIGQDFADMPPWVKLKTRAGRNGGLELYRLAMYFSGMNIGHALLEGIGWIRELGQVVAVNGSAFSAGGEKTTQRKKKPRKKRQAGNEQNDEADNEKSFLTCDILIDMIGFRAIMVVLTELVHIGLEAYTVDGAMSVESAHNQESSPLPALGLCIRLMSGIQQLYYHNHQALLAASSHAKHKLKDVATDEIFESEVISAYILALQRLYRRIEEVSLWYTNESTDVSQLQDEGVTSMHEIIGGALSIVRHCAQLAGTIRNSSSQGHEHGNATTASEERRTPGYAQRKQVNKNIKEVLSRGRKLLPRLASVCEQVRKSAERLGRSMGVKSIKKMHSLAPKSTLDDSNLYFGVGVDASDADVNMDDNDENNGSDGCVDDMMDDGDAPEAEVDGFHARGIDANNTNTQTISVRFGQRQD